MLGALKNLIPESIQKSLRKARNKGDKYECPLCGFQAERFLPIGLDMPVIRKMQIVGAGLRDGGCASCGSTDRERLIYRYFDKENGLMANASSMSVLHIAPEKNLTVKLLEKKFKEYACGDLHTPGYHYADHVKNMNVLSLPFEDNHFDVVLCNHVLEHIIPDHEAMTSIFRVLKPGGQALLQVPISLNTEETFEDDSITDPKEREVVFGQFDHVRVYGQDYAQRLSKAGFEVLKEDLSGESERYGLSKDELLYIAIKPSN
ncbi:MAG: SAM-dependent methyltransferase [Bacteroidia bacterium]|jgi:SAM-dependent methyltransferase